MTVKMREMLGTLPSYVPGKTVPGAIKLASNETAYPPLPSVLERISVAAKSINRYPDNGSVQLTEAIAARYGAEARQVAVGCGSVSLCTQLVQSVADHGHEVIYAWRSFEAYPIIAAVAGAVSVEVPLVDHVHDLDAMASRITSNTRLIFVCCPNNPTATALGRAAFERFMSRVPSDVTVALDEAYHEFVIDPDVPNGLDLIGSYPNLVVLRTFSKAYGLAGLRVGYAIALDPAIATALRQTQVPFAVSHLAQEAALASLEPAAERELFERVTKTQQEVTRVRAELLAIGYPVPPSQANFVWLPLGEQSSNWTQECAERGVIVRPFAGDGVRVTVSSVEENDRLLEVASETAAAVGMDRDSAPLRS